MRKQRSQSQLRRARIAGKGTTGCDLLGRVHELSTSLVGSEASLWAFRGADAVTEMCTVRPSNVRFVSLSAPLDKLYPKRCDLGLPEWAVNTKEEHWKPPELGNGKDQLAAALGTLVVEDALRDTRRWSIEHVMSAEANRDAAEFLQAHPDALLNPADPMSIHLAGMGASTAVPGTLREIEWDLEETSGVPVIVILVGPWCGATSDDYKSELDCALNFLVSLQEIAARPATAGWLWGFHFDGTLSERDSVLNAAARFAFSLMARSEGEEMLRLLKDGAEAARRKCCDRLPPTFLCSVSTTTFHVPGAELVNECAASILAETLRR